jgi:hypothetical protein
LRGEKLPRGVKRRSGWRRGRSASGLRLESYVDVDPGGRALWCEAHDLSLRRDIDSVRAAGRIRKALSVYDHLVGVARSFAPRGSRRGSRPAANGRL